MHNATWHYFDRPYHTMGRLERKLSEQNVSAPPSYEEAVSQSPLHYERYEVYNTEITYSQRNLQLYYYFDCRDGEISAASAPKGSSPKSDNPHQKTSAPTRSSLVSDNPIEATAAASTGTSENREVEAFDEFDPRGHLVSGVRSALFLVLKMYTRVGVYYSLFDFF